MIEHDNLVAIAYKTGFCGSLIYYILAHSPEVKQYQPLPDPTFNDGTSHDGTEYWFKDLHNFQDSLTVSEERWDSYQTDESREALQDKDKLIFFRCHPTIAYKLDFINKLKVLFLTHDNPILCERWAYEKVYKPLGENHFNEIFKKVFNKDKAPEKIKSVLKRQFLIDNIRHEIVSAKKCYEKYKENFFNVKLEKILSNDYSHYNELCNFLNISAISNNEFDQIINNYNKKQWKRFFSIASMEKILIDWLTNYTGVKVDKNTKFINLNFDIFDEAVVVDFVSNEYGVNVNKDEEWFISVGDLLNAISEGTSTHVWIA